MYTGRPINFQADSTGYKIRKDYLKGGGVRLVMWESVSDAFGNMYWRALYEVSNQSSSESNVYAIMKLLYDVVSEREDA